MRDSFLDFLNSLYIATEAEDITQQAAEDARDAFGGKNMVTQDQGREEDLMNTDDIFGDKPQSNDSSENGDQPDDQPDDQSGDPNLNNDENPDQNGDEGNNENPDEQGDSENSEPSNDPNLEENSDNDQSGDNQNDDLLFAKKNTIRDNLAQLYTVIAGDIETLVSILSSLNDANSLKVINAVLLHLRNSKEYLYKTLTTELTHLEYDELLRRYVTIKRVYDICIKMLETHFHDNEKDKDKKKKK